MTVTVSQDAEKLDLVWVASDPVSLAFTVEDVDWSGTYTAQIRAERSATSTLIGTLTVTQVNSALIAAGTYYWDLQQTSGVTRLAGKVSVQPHVTT
jgi:hypothetical protein